MTLRSKVLRGSVWVVAFRWFARALGLINVAIIARILSPEDFGLVAMAMLVLGFIEAWLAFGLENACVQRERSASRAPGHRLVDAADSGRSS